MFDLKKGSEWNKWDLHVHTPKSIEQQFGGDQDSVWDEYVESLKNLPSEIKVLGVTDYLFIDGYEKLLSRRADFPNIELLLPNIEFRLNTFSGTQNNNKRHNFHVIFDESVSVEEIKEQLLNCLSTAYLLESNEKWEQTPTRRSLEELGKSIKRAAPEGNTVHSKSDLFVGFSNITYDEADIRKNLNKNCFKGKFVTAIGYSEWDLARWDQSAAEKRTLINKADFALTCCDDPGIIEGHIEELENNRLNSIVFHSSDAHKLSDLGNTNLWLKSDISFSGLKQVLNEPKCRIHIGSSPPNYKRDHKVISQVDITNSNDWFDESLTIPLNRDLVSVIGGRGSGKSALAEMIAYAGGAYDPQNDSFISKANQHKNSIEGTKIKLTWEDGEITESEIGKPVETELVKYLPQKAVESLCSPENEMALQEQIENVVFQHIEDSEKLGATHFGHLKGKIIKNFEIEKENLIEQVSTLSRELFNTRETVNQGVRKSETLKKKKEEIENLKKLLPKLSKEEEKVQQEIIKFKNLQQAFEEAITKRKLKAQKLEEIESRVKVFKSEIEEFSDDISRLSESLEDSKFINSFKVGLDEEAIKNTIQGTRTNLNSEIQNLQAGEKVQVDQLEAKLLENSDFNDYHNLVLIRKKIEELQKQTKVYETKKLRYQKQQEAILKLQKEILDLEKDIKLIKEYYEPKIATTREKIITRYCEFFQVLIKEKEALERLYSPLQNILSRRESQTETSLDFEAKFKYDIASHNIQGVHMIDRTKRGNFKPEGSLESALSEFWRGLRVNDFAETAIKESLRTLFGKFKYEELDSNGDVLYSAGIEDQIRSGYTRGNFYQWFFDLSQFSVVSSLKFQGVDLDLLSPGQKGIVLLMLYLEIDEADTRPLIIDQPEDNLDNRSVYDDLIGFFRKRKQYRQIIIITHNPNLVVNTDSEQVIAAQYLAGGVPRLKYHSGSLENTIRETPETPIEDMDDCILEKVCELLEGGSKAFVRRRDKYNLSPKIARNY